ncbi:ankyrin repeat protein [Pseudarthrobacter sp. W1I19]|uniref:ankyrin repeat domain-containing protein n=1 Tax=Pseudarthrobacter sp. W1I19 TaxID=3042288 RepID=UPI00277D8965|nr:ankyrin repeat domain-containing protein [Pseudarthrobacter sp. W1I19]MDQ0925073.1 ankyrin repeat protein [Pseudarthrobacter sp. W1I19]
MKRVGACCLAVSLTLATAACQAGSEATQPPQPAPSSSLAGTEGTTAAAETPSAPARAPAPAAAPPVLSAEEQAQLDQELIAAAKANNVPLVQELIGRGGNVNTKDAIQDSAFLYAGAEGFNEVLRLTLDAGADVASTNRYGGTALIPASEHGHVETVRILIAAGVPVNHVNNLGWTAMQEAILLNNGGPRQQEVVRMLLDAGADPDIRDREGRTALQNAERLGFAEIAALVRSRG